jgi:DUF1009 family protein
MQAVTDASHPDASNAPLAILAGGGEFPVRVASAAIAAGRPVRVFGIVEEASAAIEAYPHVWLKRGQLGALVAGLRSAGIVDLVMIGGIRQRRMPRLDEIDAGGLWHIVCNLGLLRRGDDSVLRFIARVIEARGFRVVGAADVAPDLAIGAGVFTRVHPGEADWLDIDVGLEAARALGARDRGQAVVAMNGSVIARETAAGTDAMLATVGRLSRSSSTATGCLVKCLKPGQDRRLDMPAIGPDTVAAAISAGLRGIAVGAGETLVIDLAAVVAALDAHGMFLVGVTPDLRRVDP